MNSEDMIRMAQEAGLVRFEGGELEAYGIAEASHDDHSRAYWRIADEHRLKRFAALVEAAVRNNVHTCHKDCQNPACVAVREAVAAEREKCAKECQDDGWSVAAHAIRARGNR
jgi:cobalamin biosynthesis Mg chelatase CobN